MAMRPTPPRVFGVLLTLLGLVFAGGSIDLLTLGGPLGGSLYFLAVGVGGAVSGGLIACGKLVGAYCYAVVLGGIMVWSVVERSGNVQMLLARSVLPACIGAYIFSSKMRPWLA